MRQLRAECAQKAEANRKLMASQKMVMLKLSPDQPPASLLRASPPLFLGAQILKSSVAVITSNPMLTVGAARLYLRKTTERYQLFFSKVAFVFRGKYVR